MWEPSIFLLQSYVHNKYIILPNPFFVIYYTLFDDLTHWHWGNIVLILTHCPQRSLCNFKNAIFQSWFTDFIIRSYDNALRCVLLYLSDGKSTVVQVMAWCSLATSHYLDQCVPRSVSPYDTIRPQWVNIFDFIFYLYIRFGPAGLVTKPCSVVTQ